MDATNCVVSVVGRQPAVSEAAACYVWGAEGAGAGAGAIDPQLGAEGGATRAGAGAGAAHPQFDAEGGATRAVAARYPPIRAGVYMLQRLGIMWEQPADAGAAGGAA